MRTNLFKYGFAGLRSGSSCARMPLLGDVMSYSFHFLRIPSSQIWPLSVQILFLVSTSTQRTVSSSQQRYTQQWHDRRSGNSDGDRVPQDTLLTCPLTKTVYENAAEIPYNGSVAVKSSAPNIWCASKSSLDEREGRSVKESVVSASAFLVVNDVERRERS